MPDVLGNMPRPVNPNDPRNRRRPPKPGDPFTGTLPTPHTQPGVPPPPDRMGWMGDAHQVHDRYAKAPDDMAAYAAQANQNLAQHAALIGGDPGALGEVQGHLGTMVKPTTDAVNADHQRWDAWWNVVPGSDYERLLSLGRAAQQLYDIRHKAGKKKAKGGGKAPGTVYGPPPIPKIGGPNGAPPPGYSGVDPNQTYVPGVI